MRGGRLLIGVVIAIFSIISYYAMKEENPITGENQAVGMTTDQELALGQQAAPRMAQEFGGLDPSPELQAFIDEVGSRLVQSSDARNTDWKFDFNLLGDTQTVNAFALPGGPIFITRALLARMTDEAQLAGVLGHEIGHVVARHAAEQAAKTQLGQGLVGAVAVGTANDAGYSAGGQMAQFVAQMTLMRYGREDELQSDQLGVRFMADAGYDPRALIDVMEILAQASGGQPRGPEFSSTHPDPGNRKAVIEKAIRERFPNGVEGTRGRTIARN
ncbi:MAG TPA: M48 family metalloprotease [Vicinamibacterales bacterium]|nr:M48 family metalloprotease [Vicinamibacterales bacterium]